MPTAIAPLTHSRLSSKKAISLGGTSSALADVQIRLRIRLPQTHLIGIKALVEPVLQVQLLIEALHVQRVRVAQARDAVLWPEPFQQFQRARVRSAQPRLILRKKSLAGHG